MLIISNDTEILAVWSGDENTLESLYPDQTELWQTLKALNKPDDRNIISNWREHLPVIEDGQLKDVKRKGL